MQKMELTEEEMKITRMVATLGWDFIKQEPNPENGDVSGQSSSVPFDLESLEKRFEQYRMNRMRRDHRSEGLQVSEAEKQEIRRRYLEILKKNGISMDDRTIRYISVKLPPERYKEQIKTVLVITIGAIGLTVLGFYLRYDGWLFILSFFFSIIMIVLLISKIKGLIRAKREERKDPMVSGKESTGSASSADLLGSSNSANPFGSSGSDIFGSSSSDPFERH